MNRRDLFKFAGMGAAALLVPTTTFFLPPPGGWGAQRMKIRRVQQYLINDDTYPIRYDGTWDLPNGEGVQFHVDFELVLAEEWGQGKLRHYDEMARRVLEDRMYHDGGTPNSAHFKLALPRGLPFADYI